MDTFGKSIPLFFLIILLLCVDTLARESRFFNKVNRESKNVQQVKAEEEEPSFVPQTSENSPYGLYGRGTDVYNSPSTTTTEKLKEQPTYFETHEEAIPTTTTAEPEYSNYFHRKNYATELQGVDGYSKAYFYNNNNNKGNYYYNGERQGMSDTRFMENGKYYYNVNSEPNLPTYNYGAYQNSNGGRRPEYYNNEGYYSGTTQGFNDNKGQQTLQEQDFDFDP